MSRPPPISPLFPYTTLFRSFAQSRLSTEILTTYLKDDFEGVPGTGRGPGAAGSGDARIRGYRGGYLPNRRREIERDRKSTRLNSSHANISYAVFCLKKKKHK